MRHVLDVASSDDLDRALDDANALREVDAVIADLSPRRRLMVQRWLAGWPASVAGAMGGFSEPVGMRWILELEQAVIGAMVQRAIRAPHEGPRTTEGDAVARARPARQRLADLADIAAARPRGLYNPALRRAVIAFKVAREAPCGPPSGAPP
jgi:hypothetical protein